MVTVGTVMNGYEETHFDHGGIVRHSFLFLAGLIYLVLGGSSPALASKCYGLDPCNACRNCHACKHCHELGGTCGICKKEKNALSRRSRWSKNVHSDTGKRMRVVRVSYVLFEYVTVEMEYGRNGSDAFIA